MRQLRVRFGTVAGLMLFVGFACGGLAYGADDKAGDGGKSLFETTCGKCHPLDRPTKKVKVADDWKNTVLRMKNVNGARVTDADAKIIIEYLVKNYSLR